MTGIIIIVGIYIAIERVQREHVTVTLGFIGSDGWYGCDYFPMMITPTYWQPLPDPPKGE